MRIAIVDDEDLQRNTIHTLLSKELKKYDIPLLTIDCFPSGTSFLDQFQSDQYSIIILDIYMGDDFGIDIARQIRKIDPDVLLIFCTTSNEFASESYEVNARYYLHKPINENSVHQMLERLNLNVLLTQRIIKLPDETRIRVNHIMYTIYDNHKITLYFTNNQSLTVYMNQQDMEDLLEVSKHEFHKINRGTIVNFNHVKMIQKKDFIMKDDAALPISRGNFKEISSLYMDYKIQSLAN